MSARAPQINSRYYAELKRSQLIQEIHGYGPNYLLRENEDELCRQLLLADLRGRSFVLHSRGVVHHLDVGKLVLVKLRGRAAFQVRNVRCMTSRRSELNCRER